MVPDHSLRPAPEEQVQLVQCDTPTASSRLLYARRRALAPASNTSNCSGDTAESTASSTDHLPPITDHCIKKYRATYCARNDPLPLLPSGPGGVGGITSRRTRHCSILSFSAAAAFAQPWYSGLTGDGQPFGGRSCPGSLPRASDCTGRGAAHRPVAAQLAPARASAMRRGRVECRATCASPDCPMVARSRPHLLAHRPHSRLPPHHDAPHPHRSPARLSRTQSRPCQQIGRASCRERG